MSARVCLAANSLGYPEGGGLLWVYLTLPVCLLAPAVTRFLDRALTWAVDAVVTIFSAIVCILS